MKFGRHAVRGILVFSLVLHAAAARAGLRISYEAVSYSNEDETTVQEIDRRQNVLLIDEGRLRTIGGDAEGFDLIADIRVPAIYVLDATRQSFAQLDFPPAADTRPEPETGDLVIEIKDDAEPVMGYTTHLYRIYEDSSLIREIWTTQDFDLGFDFMRMMEGLEIEFEKFAPQEDFDQLVRLFRQVRGVPLIDVQYYPSGKDVLQAKNIQKKIFKAEDFLPPKKYAQKTLKDLAEGPPEPGASGGGMGMGGQ